ncbi:MAG: hypothetical protein ACFFDI_22200, partial [Promethearchaeota archaeon]
KVSRLAKKAKSFDAKTICRFEYICVADLLGARFKLKPQIPRIDGHEFITEEGSKGIIFEESFEDNILKRWALMDFNDKDLKAAADHIKIRSYDLEKSRSIMANLYPKNAKHTSLKEISAWIEYAFSIYPAQWELIESKMNILNLAQLEKGRIRDRWKAENQPKFKDFSAYAFYCYRLGSIFWLGVTSGIIPTSKKEKTIIDYQYLFYIPFIHTFCSNDKFHKQFSEYFLRTDQDFVWGDNLKKDLGVISSCYKNMTKKEKVYYEKNFGHYPPPIQNSITNKLWQKHMRPWSPGSGNLAIDMPEKRKKKMAEKINRIIKIYEESRGKR